jgi:hypothetical protein
MIIVDLSIIPGLHRASKLIFKDPADRQGGGFNLNALSGRVIELSAPQNTACLTLSCTLILEAQKSGVAAVWISASSDTFFPPDFHANGVELCALPIVIVPGARSAGKAADWLLRSKAFRLLVVDLGRDLDLPLSLQSRLAQLSRHQGCTLVLLTVKPAGSPSLGSMVSLYGRVEMRRTGNGRFLCTLRILKDKQRAPVWKHSEELCGPPGLC